MLVTGGIIVHCKSKARFPIAILALTPTFTGLRTSKFISVDKVRRLGGLWIHLVDRDLRRRMAHDKSERRRVSDPQTCVLFRPVAGC